MKGLLADLRHRFRMAFDPGYRRAHLEMRSMLLDSIAEIEEVDFIYGEGTADIEAIANKHLRALMERLGLKT